ncbi:hypothetical protein [Polaribacter septentrionalilitoris]|uniref:hypothetical protein n=1 Tax=Polaribacter septentrionalilitoris TaxID=2494657 RepID=UPI00135B0B03|nr:hypothetical protein [Polaribacter septentrionalilitoris]
MKKIFYLFAITALVFTSCNPLEDINQEVDALTANDKLVDDLVLTLTDEDYEELGLSFGNFSSVDDAKEALPGFLAENYPQLGVTYNPDGTIAQSSSAIVTYKLFSPIKYESYTVTDADYSAIGLTSLNDAGDYNDFFDYKFPSEAKGTVVDLTYKAEPTITSYTLNDDDYDFVGNGRFDNFDIRTGRDEETIEARRVKIQTILLNNFPDADFGAKYKVTYDAFNNDFETVNLDMEVILTDNAPDPAKTTDYTLTEADFDSVGNGQFDNFDIREGRGEETIESRRAKIETILLANFPAAVDGDIYRVTYAVWEGFDSTRTMLVVKNGNAYDLFSAKTYELYTFALEDATMRFTLAEEWAAPVTFTRAEYTLMGQRFPNFDDRDEAVYNIGIYLKTLYPFAKPDDFVAVQYDYFSSGVSQRNVNFVFDGTVWNAIPTVIETQLQLGHDGTNWVPDNTIKYTLTAADIAYISNEFITTYPGPADNVGFFGSFDRRESSSNYWNDDMLLEAFNALLNNINPSAEEGQKYAVTYVIYDGATGENTMNLIKTGGVFVKQ